MTELDAIARANAADEAAWGDWELDWTDGEANLSDRSGHENHLTVQEGGRLYQGAGFPAF